MTFQRFSPLGRATLRLVRVVEIVGLVGLLLASLYLLLAMPFSDMELGTKMLGASLGTVGTVYCLHAFFPRSWHLEFAAVNLGSLAALFGGLFHLFVGAASFFLPNEIPVWARFYMVLVGTLLTGASVRLLRSFRKP